MSYARMILVALISLAAWHIAPQVRAEPSVNTRALEILRKHCLECHGPDLKKPKGDLNLLTAAALADTERKIVVAKAPDESELIKLVAKGSMPPGKRPKVPAEELKVLRDWISAGAEPLRALNVTAVADRSTGEVDVARVKEIFRTQCLDCHGGRGAPRAGLKILDHPLLIDKKLVVAKSPDESELFQRITATDGTGMPPSGQPRLPAADIEIIRRWIAAGAPVFPEDVTLPQAQVKDDAFKGLVGVDYVLQEILRDVKARNPADRPFMRYLSFNHMLVGGASKGELERDAAALGKTINHLSMQPTLVRPEPIEKTGTVFRIDLRQLGWDKQPFKLIRDKKDAGPARVNLYDLALLEYPYSTFYEASVTHDELVNEFLVPARQVRPIPYVRADWFISTATLPPLYYDFLQLPQKLEDLESFLGVDSQRNIDTFRARRAGMSESGVSHSNRVVERHPSRFGSYWKSFDFKSSKGQDNMYKDPINLKPAGGEMIFSLPNGLQGYFLTDARGNRIDAGPTEVVTDSTALDQTVRNGLSCMRCHDKGMKGFVDTVRPAVEKLPGSPGFDKRQVLDLYAEETEMNVLLKEDTKRFQDAMTKLLGKLPLAEPITPVSKRFGEGALQLSTAGYELGLSSPEGLAQMFRSPQFASLGLLPLASDGVVRRDMWEDYYTQVVQQLGLGLPVAGLDATTRGDHAPIPSEVKVELTTNRKNNLFTPGDELILSVKNTSLKDVFIELIGTGASGGKVILATGIKVAPGKTYQHPKVPISPGVGKEKVTVFACDSEFPKGELVQGDGVTDRVIHGFYRMARNGRRIGMVFDAARMVKKTIEIETR